MAVEFEVIFDEGASFDVDMSTGDEGSPVLMDEHYAISGALDDLTDVEITSPSNGQVLKYDSTTETWVNGSGGGGGGGGTDDYSDLSNKPKINGVTLSGNKSAADLSLGTYTKPAGGIPDADIASASTWNAKGTYSKPSGGIPASDLASAVQTSLGKADTALQSAPVSSVNTKTGAVVLDAGDLEYDDTETYSSGTVGDALTDLKGDLAQTEQKVDAALPHNTVTGAIVTFSDGADNIPVNDLTVAIEPVQSGSGDPSPSNVRPITGWSQAMVARCGKNLVPLDGWEQGQLSGGNGIPNGVSYSVSSPFILLKGGKTYMLSRNYPEYGSGQMAYHTYTLDKIHVSDSGWVTNNQTISPSNDCYIRLTTRAKPNTENPPDLSPSDVGTMFTVQLEIGSTATTYEPYNGQTYTIDLDGTRYGGTLDVTTGVLTVDRAIVTLNGSENWSLWNSTGKKLFAVVPLMSDSNFKPLSSSISNQFKFIGRYGAPPYAMQEGDYLFNAGDNINWNKNVSFYYPSIGEDVADWKTYLSQNNLQVTYELATPTTVQLTPQEVTTLLGNNTIFADCGDVTVDYNADATLYINSHGGGSSPSPYTSNPSALGTASPGSSDAYARGDHVHAMPTASDIGAIAAPVSASNGQFLGWNGSAWVAASLPVYSGGVS